uniref:Fe2OG dioxygenase domain-containing protein n=1 Tax=Pyramimonas obovata TaxID=1411642 RepID=A0A7S0QVX4_9CHLO|mmetsp:Transcript_14237/g.30490  ORF Transcript_14237/g.30490 Transcript_14237/m.30490 type:complete len:294 (+) Transcript_14237:172-1053(+)|eukprot:CAMPEP_0118923310 /NCGR_PEP_ID=MMETSP1169-20130426/1882_1 /TAXON_ID=36882 /ORGANISM="Pyramimonas obovata, Strain CCMP722" /LENGTH=293 /DNA_ID=CAMNT_0006864277 /DNA_START=172 /DNA_END=1053 /DNA_ORIENTATION=-
MAAYRNLAVLALWLFSGPRASVTISLSESERASAFVGYSEKHVGSWDTVTDKEFLESEGYKNLTEPILLSKSPCAILLPNFIKPEDAKQMINRATPKLRSQRFHDQPDTRTSWGTVLWGNDDLSGGTVRRSEQLVQAARSDGLEVKRYRVGEKYNSHHDYFSGPAKQLKDDRIATFLIYLQSAEVGGETFFPWAGGKEKIDPRTGWPYRPLDYNRECDPEGQPEGAVKVAVPTGSAVLFYNTLPNGEVDPYSQHGSCPVKVGEKWTATVWTRGKDRFDPNDRWKYAEILKMCA